jgi:hypothetical protein
MGAASGQTARKREMNSFGETVDKSICTAEFC